MNQSSVIAATLLGGFVLFLAAKNRLVVYANVLWGPISPPPTLATSGTPSQQAVSKSLFGASGPTTPSLNPLQGLGSVIMAIPEIFAP